MSNQSTTNLYEVVYSSHSLITDEGLGILLNNAHANNLVLGITGVLLHDGKEFVQILEGNKETVVGLMQTIRDDPRHRNFTLLRSGPISERRWGQWLMASLSISPEDYASVIQGFKNSSFRIERKIADWMDKSCT